VDGIDRRVSDPWEGPVDESEDADNFPIPVISLILNIYTCLQLIFMKP
jgi:hypothetical protein